VAQPKLPGLLASLAPVLDHYGYLAVAGLVFLEDFGVPVPGETILIAAAVYAGAHRLNVVAVGLIALGAAVLGDNVGYAIGYFGGHRLVLRFGRYVFLTKERLDKAEGFFRRHGGKVVTVARFIEGLRQANGIIAGITEMYWPKFVVFNAVGATLWVGVWLTVGYAAGSHINAVYRVLNHYLLVAVAVLVAAAIARFGVRRLRRRRADGSAGAGEPDQRDPASAATDHRGD
jgi:membrane protein DedA with SNARE-associated domain